MIVYVLALSAALLFGIGSVVQHRSASHAPPGTALRPSLLLWLVRQPLWLAGVGTSITGNLFSGAALGLGSVALVQPLLVTRLLFALPLSALWNRRFLTARDWLGAAATAGGLAAFLAAGRPSPGEVHSPTVLRWALGVGAIAVGAGLLALLARRLRPLRAAPLLGLGAGLLFGLQSGFTHTAVRAFIDDGLVGILTTWTTYATAVSAVTATLLAQSAFSMAPLPASYPALAAIEPLAGIGIGVAVLGGALVLEPLAVAVQVVGLVVMTAGITLLATSPLITGQLDLLERRREEELETRVAAELRRLLDRLERTVPTADADRQEADLARVDDCFRQLRELREDSERHRAAERARSAERPPEERATLAAREEELDRWQAALDEEISELEERSDQLRRLVAGAGGATSDGR